MTLNSQLYHVLKIEYNKIIEQEITVLYAIHNPNILSSIKNIGTNQVSEYAGYKGLMRTHRPFKPLNKGKVEKLLHLVYRKTVESFPYKEIIYERIHNRSPNWKSKYRYIIPCRYPEGTILGGYTAFEITWRLRIKPNHLTREFPMLRSMIPVMFEYHTGFEILKQPESGNVYVLFQGSIVRRITLSSTGHIRFPSNVGHFDDYMSDIACWSEQTTLGDLGIGKIAFLLNRYDNLFRYLYSYERGIGIPFTQYRGIYHNISLDGLNINNWSFLIDRIPKEHFLVLESIKSALTFVEQSRKLKFNEHD